MMTIEDQLLNEIQATLGGAITPSLTRADPSGLFEGYIFSLILRAAINEGAGAPIDYVDVRNNFNPPIFVTTQVPKRPGKGDHGRQPSEQPAWNGLASAS